MPDLTVESYIIDDGKITKTTPEAMEQLVKRIKNRLENLIITTKEEE